MKNLLLITVLLLSIMVAFAIPSSNNLADEIPLSNSPDDRTITSEVTGNTSGNNAEDVRLGVYTDTGHQLTIVGDKAAGFGESQTIWVSADTTYYIRMVLRMGFMLCLLSLMVWLKVVGDL